MATLQAPRKQKSLTAAEWREIVRRLAHQVTEWSREEGWAAQALEARVLEGYPYPPTVVIQAPQGRLMLELPDPETYSALRPKLYAWPGLYRVWLSHRGEQLGWEIWTESGIPIHEDWNKKTFITLANDLMRAE